jgi:Flp pilus assembly pilin Flp
MQAARREEGQALAEYAVVLAAVALVGAAAYLVFGQAIVAMFGPILEAVAP